MLITLDTDPAFHEQVAARVADAGLVGEVIRAFSVDEVEHALGGGSRPDVVIGGSGVPMSDLLVLTAQLRERVPQCIVLAVATPTTATLRAALRAGIRDVLVPSFTSQDLAEALAATGFGRTPEALVLPGRTIAVFSAKGGVGTSVLASNLALRLAALTGAPTVLADCDLASADQAVLHGLRPSYTIQDVADGAVDQDTEALEQVLLPVPDTQLRVLAGPRDPAAAEGIADEAVLDALRRLRQLVGLVVVDTASAFTDATLTVLEHADEIVLPVSLDVLSLRSLVVTLQTFDRLGIDRSHLHVVAIRADTKVGLTRDDVVRTTGVPISVSVPSSREVPRSVNTATPLALGATRSAVVRAVDELAQLLVDGVEIHGATDVGGASGGRGRFLRRGSVASSPSLSPPPPLAAEPTRAPAPAPEASPASDPVPALEPEEAAVGPAVAAVVVESASPTGSRRTSPTAAAPRAVRVRRATVAVPLAAPARPAAGETSTEDDAEDLDAPGDDADDADVIALAPPHDRLAAMPPPVFDEAPAQTGHDTSRRRRRNARR